jgi:lauroyl/myristoyl acyltransferase
VVLTVRPPTPALLFDLGRWALQELIRESVPPENPEILRLLAGVSWRMTAAMKPARKALLLDELRRCFGVNLRTAENIAREAHDATLQARLELPLLPRVQDFSPYLRIFGELPEGCLLLHPTVVGVELMRAALSRRYPDLVVFGKRAFPEEGVGPLQDNAINRLSLKRMREEQQNLPIRWEEEAGALVSHLQAGRRVVVAFDDRAWSRFEPVTFLGRMALVSPEPWELALRLGVPVVPATITRERDKSYRVGIGAPIKPDLRSYLRNDVEPFLKQHPGAVAMWLAECRRNATMDDHPFFLDYALDGRYRRWTDPERAIDRSTATR